MMTDGRVRWTMDRLPWLEPTSGQKCRAPRPTPRRKVSWLAYSVGAARRLLVAGVSYWLGMRSMSEPDLSNEPRRRLPLRRRRFRPATERAEPAVMPEVTPVAEACSGQARPSRDRARSKSQHGARSRAATAAKAALPARKPQRNAGYRPRKTRSAAAPAPPGWSVLAGDRSLAGPGRPDDPDRHVRNRRAGQQWLVGARLATIRAAQIAGGGRPGRLRAATGDPIIGCAFGTTSRAQSKISCLRTAA